jgi:DNA-binding MarR family transcriptional regulator
VAESSYSEENLVYIRSHLERIEQFERFNAAANPASRSAVEAQLRERDGAAAVYLALSDGPKSQDELIAITKLSQSTVSRICKHLLDFGLILTTRSPKQSRVSLYAQTELERLLGVSKIAKRIINS